MVMRLSNIRALLTQVSLVLCVVFCSHGARANGIVGDFNYDGLIDVVDADLMTDEIAAGTNLLSFDLTSDGSVDLADLDNWFGHYSSYSGVPLAIALVDVNFDTVNTAADYMTIQFNLLSTSSSFSDGDLNATGIVDTADLDLYMSRGGVVPEPSTLSVLLLGSIVVRKRKALRI